MVRLKVKVSGGDVYGNEKFQFHYGSVKSAMATMSVHRTKKFQFHYGSVKRLIAVKLHRKV